MKLTLSSAAAPGAAMEELLEACRRRGFAAVELEAGHAHGVSLGAGPGSALGAAALADAAGVAIAGFRVNGAPGAGVLELLRFQEALGAPLILHAADPADVATARSLAESRPDGTAGPRALLATDDPDGLPGDLPASVGLAWDFRPDAAAAGGTGDVPTVVDIPGTRLAHVRLFGGGPESDLHEGGGIGSLMGRLALSGFGGTLAVAPSSPRYRVAWDAWLGRRGGWGCGSRRQAPELVQIGGTGAMVGGGER